MAEAYGVVIRWIGPILLADVHEYLSELGECEGLYAAIGVHRPFGWLLPKAIQYIGESNELNRRVDPRLHDKLSRLSKKSTKMWIGIPVSQYRQDDLNGRNKRLDILRAEGTLAFLYQAKLNRSDRRSLPGHSVTLKNQFYTTNGNPSPKRPHANFADLLDLDLEQNRAVLTWYQKSNKAKSVAFRNLDNLKIGGNAKRLLDRFAKFFFSPPLDYNQEYQGKENTLCPKLPSPRLTIDR